MDLLEKVCKELGVEVGEIWQGGDGYRYCILDNGNIKRYEGEIVEDYMTLNVVWKDIITGKLKLKWVPEYGEKYYIPDPTYHIPEARWDVMIWNEDEFDRWYLKNNIVYKTKEEAIEAANKILESLKEEQ